MRDFIYKLRGHSTERKKLYMYIILGIAVSLLLVIWFFTVSTRFEKIKRINEASLEPGPAEIISEGLVEVVN